MSKIKIAVADDHVLFRKGLINLILDIESDFVIVLEAGNGKELMDNLVSNNLPNIVLMDANMPVMDGFEATKILKEKYPDVKIMALTMLDDDKSLISLIRSGVDGYLNKDVDPKELKDALESMARNGSYYQEHVAGKLVNIIRHPEQKDNNFSDLSEQELKFIELACSDDTYQMIADKMFLSVKTIDGYRAKLFEKFSVKSRVGLVIYALKNSIVSMENID